MKSEMRLVPELKTETETIFLSQHFLSRKKFDLRLMQQSPSGDFIEHDKPTRFTSCSSSLIGEKGRRPTFSLDLRLTGISQVKRNADAIF
ncbi:MAG TPA: hypothetical protein VLJ79_16610 [Candidatus Binatia bacterium]|nr:hypothetical protein [Candidatus Binatia bacterium]